jgi:hypothetical protein
VLAEANESFWVPASFMDKLQTDGWQSQSIFVLEFNGTVDCRNIFHRCQEYELDYAFAYSRLEDSVSMSPFNVFFQVDSPITSKKLRDSIQLSLIEIFPEAGDSSLDEERIITGGKKVIREDLSGYLNVAKLIEHAQFHAVQETVSGNRKRDLERFRKRSGLEGVGGKNNSPYSIYIGSVEKTSNSDDQPLDVAPVRNTDFEELRKTIRNWMIL